MAPLWLARILLPSLRLWLLISAEEDVLIADDDNDDFSRVLTEETSALNSGAEAKLMADAAAALSAAAAATSGAQPQGDYTFDDLKQRLTTDMDIKFNSSAWFGGASPFHKFNSDCYYALGRAVANDCVFEGKDKPSKCKQKPAEDTCGESFLPGCWHGSARAAKTKANENKPKQTSSLTCYPMARSSYVTNMLPPDKPLRLKATQFVFNHILKTVQQSFEDFKKTNAAFLKKKNVKSLSMTKDEAKEFLKDENFVETILKPKDAFWNIFTELTEPEVTGSISLCAYFAHASKSVFPNEGANTEDAIKKCRAATQAFKIPPVCLQNFPPAGADKAGDAAYENGQKFLELAAKEPDWKLFKFISWDQLISKFKGCLCFSAGCNDNGFQLPT